MVEEKKSKEVNAVAEGLNWEQRVKGELEAPQKWVKDWGQFFKNDVPLEMNERIKYFEEELKKIPQTAIHPVKYGLGKPFPHIGPDHRRRIKPDLPF